MTATEQATEPERTEETWTCAGVRVGGSGKRVMCWVRPDGKIVSLFSKRGSNAIGGRYAFKVTYGPDGELTGIWGPLHYVDRDPDNEKIAGWRAQEVAAEAHFAREAAERKAKSEDPLDEALAPLVEIARTLRTGAARDAFAAHIIRRVARAARW
jgi:hypothetical protein